MADRPAPPQPAASAPARPWAAGLGLLLPLGTVVALLLLVLAALAGAGRWLLFSEAGSRWLVDRLPFVEATGFKGALLGAHWQAERLHVSWAGGAESVTVEGLSAEGLSWAWRPHDHAWLGLDVRHVAARKLTVHTGPRGKRPLPVPHSIAMPFQLALHDGRVAELAIDALAPMRQLSVAGLVLDSRPGARHGVEQAAFEWYGVSVVASARIGTAAPLPMVAQATLRPTLEGAAPRWAAVLRAGGDVAHIDLTGTLRGVPRAGRDAPLLDLHAGLRPLEAWPLGALTLQTQALDLAALSPGAPETRLSGSVELASHAQDRPLAATIRLDNALPGRWNEQRLPLQRLSAELSGRLDQPGRLELGRFELALADAANPAGSWTGNAVWQGHELKVQSRLVDVSPQRLDGRAAAMKLSGPLAATLRGLASPGPTPATRPPPHLAWKVDLEGTLDAAPQPVHLVVDGEASEQRLEFKQVHASTGSATADLRALVQRVGRTDWKVETAGNLVNFDPVPWWPGEAGTTWRQTPSRLSAGWQFELRLPGDAARLPAIALAQRVAGNGTLRIHDSVLSGVPLAADATLGYVQSGAASPASLRGEVRLGGNLVVIEGHGDPAGAGHADRWRAEIKAETLATLAPLARVHAALANWVPRQGSAVASITADGRWPALRTEGTALVQQLLVGTARISRGQANWRMGTSGEQPLALQLELADLQHGALRAQRLRADLRGTLADHQIDISAALPLAPPPLAVKVLGVHTQAGTLAQMRARGAWLADPAGGGRWRAELEHLLVGSWDGSPGATPPAPVWAQARGLRGELQFDADGGLLTLHADAGRLLVADAVALRWDDVRLDLRGAHPGIELHADIEPFALAPLLARAQPGMGWQGDLRLAARVDIRAAERFDADLVFERRGGDLHVAGSDGTQLLGLTELRVTLAAHDGLWVFNPVFKGRSLGEIAGSVRVQTTPERRWPPADAPIEGNVQARAADIGIWSAWVPPGWRLGGELRTMAALGGRFGQPRYTGQITGTGLTVRNLLQGVHVNDGQVIVRLEGDHAQIERFSLRGGDGSMAITGGASFETGLWPQSMLLKFKAERFRLLGRVDRNVIASGNAELTLQSEQMKLDGKITINEAMIDASRGEAPTLDDDVTVREAGKPVVKVAEAGVARKCAFMAGVDIDLGDGFRARWRGVDTGLRGQLRLTTTPNCQPQVHGTINAEQGTFVSYGQKLDIERGILAFSGPYDNPRLDVLALRPNLDTRVGVAITGNVQSWRPRLYSDPEKSETEKLAWLLLGRAPDGLGRNDTALLQRAAMALLAGEGEAPTDALLKSLGIDELSLRQGDTDVRETVITLGKQLSRRWYVGYERGVNATTGTWQLIYRIAQRFTLRAQSGLDNSLDAIWVWRLQETPADAGVRKSTLVPP